MGETQLVPAGYVVTKNGLGGVGVGPQQNRNSHDSNVPEVFTEPEMVMKQLLTIPYHR